MPDILIRGLDAKTIERLKARAKRNGRSLQNEAKMAVERAAGSSGVPVANILRRWESRFAGRRFANSAKLIREDRKR